MQVMCMEANQSTTMEAAKCTHILANKKKKKTVLEDIKHKDWQQRSRLCCGSACFSECFDNFFFPAVKSRHIWHPL